MKIDVADGFIERHARMEQMVKDIHKGWNNGGSPAVQRLKAKVCGLVMTATVIVLGFAGWMSWMTDKLSDLALTPK